MLNTLCGIKKLFLNTLCGIKDRFVEAVKYILRLSHNVFIGLCIMPPIAFAVTLIMQLCGVVSVSGAASQIFESGTPWYVLLITMLMVGICEEGYFRLLVMDCMFMRWLRMPYWMALILSSASFGCAHLVNGPWQVTLPQVVGAGFMGLWLARIYRTQGLATAMLTHGCYNFVVIMLAGV